MVQIGSWWETSTASPPAAAACAVYTAPSIRRAISRYGSPQDGVIGSRSLGQFAGFNRLPPGPVTWVPAKTLSASISRSSVMMGRPVRSAIAPAVCCARSKDEAAR